MHTLLRDWRAVVLGIAAIALLATVLRPAGHFRRAAYDLLVVVDITGSMNARDYALGGQPAARLDFTKRTLRELIAGLPCRSRIGLGIFTERQSFLLFEPVELCDNFGAVDSAIDSLDWRMAWEGDSYVTQGLYSAIAIARDLHSDLLFFSDGHEAPPLPRSGAPAFEGEAGEVSGVVVGVGGLEPVPIPKFDQRGHEIGFWTMAEVPQENRSGQPPSDAASRAGYDPRNAPFGGEAAVGTEHLTSVREEHLQTLARATGLGYTRLVERSRVEGAIATRAHQRLISASVDLRPIPAALALIALIVLYAMPFFNASD